MQNSVYKIDWKVNKKRGEQILADFFVKRFNKAYNLNYRVVAKSEEANDTDINAVSEHKETLNLQLKTGEPRLEQFLGSRIKHGSGMVIIDQNIEKDLAQIIEKAERHYANTKNLILLITEKQQPTFDAGYALYISDKLKNTSFKGIYLVKLPAFDAVNPYEGQIVAVKDIFGNHGRIF